MRIKQSNELTFFTKVEVEKKHGKHVLILVDMNNDIYYVKMKNKEDAHRAFETLCKHGFLDLSDYKIKLDVCYDD